MGNVDFAGLIGLLALAQLIVLTFYLLKQSLNNLRFLWAAGIAVTLLIALTHDVFLHTKLSLSFPHILGFGPWAAFLIGPLMLMLVLSFIWPNKKLSLWHSLHFVPFVVQQIGRIDIYLNSTENKLSRLIAHYQRTSMESSNYVSEKILSIEQLFSIVFFYGHRFIYFSIAIGLLYRFHSAFSDQNSTRSSARKVLIGIVSAYITYWLCIFTIPNIFNLSLLLGSVTMLNGLALSIIALLLAYWLYQFKPSEVFNNKIQKKYANSALPQGLNDKIFDDITQVVKQEEFFTDHDANLALLASKTGFTRHQLSQALNISGGTSFNMLLNEYRISYIKQLLAKGSNANVDINQLALNAGFNSKATFYRVFKTTVGNTPTHYRREMLENNEKSKNQ